MALFGNTVSRPIGLADMEFFEAAIVLRLAVILSGRSEEEFEKLGYRAKNRWIDKAREGACKLFNEKDVATRLIPLGKNLMERF